jgi:hypothetical protein
VIKTMHQQWAGYTRNSIKLPLLNHHLESSKRRWDDDIKMDLREIEWGDMDWIHLTQDMDQWRVLVNVIMNCQDP